MNLTVEYLKKLSVYDLRKLGRKYGVIAPTTKPKAELISAILDVLNGNVLPHFTARGRPPKDKIKNNQSLNTEKLLEIDKALDDFKKEIIRILNE